MFSRGIVFFFVRLTLLQIVTLGQSSVGQYVIFKNSLPLQILTKIGHLFLEAVAHTNYYGTQ